MGSYPPEKLYDQEIHTVSMPESTRLSGVATPELIAEATAFLHKDGIIILDNAIDKAHIDTLNNKLSAEALEIAEIQITTLTSARRLAIWTKPRLQPQSSCSRMCGAILSQQLC
jgi:hypothetical protein